MDKKLQDLLHRGNELKDSKNYDERIKISTQIIKLAKEPRKKSKHDKAIFEAFAAVIMPMDILNNPTFINPAIQPHYKRIQL